VGSAGVGVGVGAVAPELRLGPRRSKEMAIGCLGYLGLRLLLAAADCLLLAD
jgi:hypothetical protein